MALGALKPAREETTVTIASQAPRIDRITPPKGIIMLINAGHPTQGLAVSSVN